MVHSIADTCISGKHWDNDPRCMCKALKAVTNPKLAEMAKWIENPVFGIEMFQAAIENAYELGRADAEEQLRLADEMDKRAWIAIEHLEHCDGSGNHGKYCVRCKLSNIAGDYRYARRKGSGEVGA